MILISGMGRQGVEPRVILAVAHVRLHWSALARAMLIVIWPPDKALDDDTASHAAG